MLANWHNVLRAINMASGECSIPVDDRSAAMALVSDTPAAKIPQPPQDRPMDDAPSAIPLPQTLVRIPTEHAPALQAQADAAEEAEEGREEGSVDGVS